MSVEGHRVEGPRHGLRDLVEQATPGPWTWTHHERGPWQVGTVVDEDQRQVGGFLDFSELDDEGLTLVDFICEGGEAPPRDARLIALAPELAVLLADAKDALAAVRDWVRDGKGTESDAAEAMDSVLARIEELEGRA